MGARSIVVVPLHALVVRESILTIEPDLDAIVAILDLVAAAVASTVTDLVHGLPTNVALVAQATLSPKAARSNVLPRVVRQVVADVVVVQEEKNK